MLQVIETLRDQGNMVTMMFDMVVGSDTYEQELDGLTALLFKVESMDIEIDDHEEELPSFWLYYFSSWCAELRHTIQSQIELINWNQNN